MMHRRYVAALAALAVVASLVALDKMGWYDDRSFATPAYWKIDFARLQTEPVPSWMEDVIGASLDRASQGKNLSAALDEVLLNTTLMRGLAIVEFRVRDNVFSVHMGHDANALAAKRSSDLLAGFQALAGVARLPDMRFLVSCSDEIPASILPDVPVFAFARDDAAPEARYRPLLPDFEVLAGRHWSPLAEVVEAQARPWEAKLPRAVFRGATTGPLPSITRETFIMLPRAQAVQASLNAPDEVDARFSSLVQCADNVDVVRGIYDRFFGPPMSVFDQLQYRYVLLIDGNSASYSRGLWTAFGSSAVIKCHSTKVQWYTAQLRPYEHFIPAQANCSDVASVVRWARAHDAQARRVAATSQRFARENLRYARVMQYVELLLRHWASVSGSTA